MPLRRSTRSTRASVEPVAVDVVNAPKRKRTQPVGDEIQVEEKENVAKPQSRASRASSTRPSVGPASKGRPSTRAKEALQEVPESDEEGHVTDDAPLVKRRRPSPDVDSENEAEVDELKPKGRKSTLSSKRGASRKVVKKEPDIMDVDAEGSSKPPSGKPSANGRPTRASGRAVKPLTKPTRVKGEGESSREIINIDEEPGENEKPAAKGRKPSVKPSRSARKPSEEPPTSSAKQRIEDDEESLEYLSADEQLIPNDGDSTTLASSSRSPDRPTPPGVQVVADDQSVAVAESQPHNEPASQIQPSQAEPEGPKTRLVIHKMALVNFKSYAGRQEIGPFHKV
jgi:structural maintenance of chromosome 4